MGFHLPQLFSYSFLFLSCGSVNPQICLYNWRVKSQLAFIKLVVRDKFSKDQSPFSEVEAFQRHIYQFWGKLLFLVVFLLFRSQFTGQR
jgi:hypothetical protein